MNAELENLFEQAVGLNGTHKFEDCNHKTNEEVPTR